MSDVPSAIESGRLGESDSQKPKLKIASEKADWFSKVSESLGEWCSSILVKETRQALKSRQFIWTYIVLLFAVGLWTVMGMAMFDNRYEVGRQLLLGFWFILGFPLGLIIPFTAYRSLAREFEDGTISLISITTMKPYQIVVGKFGSALLQMMIYLSVLAPCICFTYLLRGITLDEIILGLLISVGGSICLTVLGLFLAGVFRSRTLGIGVSVLFVLLLGWLYWGWCVIMEDVSGSSVTMPWEQPEFVSFFFGTVAFFASTAGLLLVAAASQISFPSDNRSTWIRAAMFVQQILYFAFLVTVFPIVPGVGDDVVYVAVMFSCHYWLIMGLLMVGESPILSRRVQRTLPRTTQTRSWLSLFMPGSGRGFLFAVANLWTCLLLACLIAGFSHYLLDSKTRELLTGNWRRTTLGISLTTQTVFAAATACIYATWFLALFYLVNRFFLDKRKPVWTTGVGPIVTLLLGVLFIALLSIGSAIMHFTYFYDYRDDMFSPFSSLNWYLTPYSILDSGVNWSSSPLTFLFSTLSYFLFFLQAFAVIAFAIALASKELLVKPIEVPERVRIEEEKPKERKLAVGESIDEIFGELKPREPIE